MTALPDHGRFPYSAIGDRPQFTWPGGARLACYIAVNLEHFAFGEGLGAERAPTHGQPDVLNWSWREYGNRVGAWRMLDLLDELGLPCAALVNSAIYDHCPDLPAAFRARGDEIVAHGRSNAERQGECDEPAERALIEGATQVLTRAEGRAPRGWLGPWISQSRVTPDLLAEAGYRYLLDWAMDDQPVWMTTRGGGRILSVPYPQELNDIPALVARDGEAAGFCDRIVDGFSEMLDQSARQPLVFAVALHPYIFGQPHRLRRLRVALKAIAARSGPWWTTPGAIADAYAAVEGARECG